MKFKKEYTLPLLLILTFALGIRLIKHYPFGSLSLESAILSVLILPILLTIYFIIFRITRNNPSALFAITIAAVMPLEFDSYLWAVSAVFFFLAIFASVIIRKKPKNWFLYLIFPVVAALTHSSAILLAPIFIINLVLLALEQNTIKKEELMYSVFTAIASFMLVLIFLGLPDKYSPINVSAITLFALVGTRPVIFGVAGAYTAIKKNINQSLILISTAGIVFFALAFKMLSIFIGSPYLFASLAALSGVFFMKTMQFIKKSRLTKFYDLIQVALFVFILITGLIHWM